MADGAARNEFYCSILSIFVGRWLGLSFVGQSSSSARRRAASHLSFRANRYPYPAQEQE